MEFMSETDKEEELIITPEIRVMEEENVLYVQTAALKNEILDLKEQMAEEQAEIKNMKATMKKAWDKQGKQGNAPAVKESDEKMEKWWRG